MKKIFWVCTLVLVFVFSWTTVYAGDFYVIPGMKKNFLPVPKTGQTKCYNEAGTEIPDCSGTGQDGDHQKGVAWPDPRFTDNGNGTVTDNLTGLIWLKDSTELGEKNGPMPWLHVMGWELVPADLQTAHLQAIGVCQTSVSFIAL